MTSPPNKNDSALEYLRDLKKIILLSAAALGVSLLIRACAWTTAKLSGQMSGFDLASEQLLHYPKTASGVLAFFAAELFLLCLTVIFEGWPPALWARKWIVVPALGIAEHMLALVAGVLFAWGLVEPLATITFAAALERTGLVGFSVVPLLIFSCVCSAAARFFKSDYDQLRNRWGRAFFLLILGCASAFAVAAYQDLVQIHIPDAKVHG